jgi:hypothetical protein
MCSVDHQLRGEEKFCAGRAGVGFPDGTIITHDTTELLCGHLNIDVDTPLMIGSNRDEFAPDSWIGEFESPSEVYTKWLKDVNGFTSDHTSSCFEEALKLAQRAGSAPSADVQEAQMHVVQGVMIDTFIAAVQRRQHVYRYSFEQYQYGTPYGACDSPGHICELPYLFEDCRVEAMFAPMLGVNAETRSAMIETWLRFAVVGAPGWAPGEVGVFDEGLTVEYLPLHGRGAAEALQAQFFCEPAALEACLTPEVCADLEAAQGAAEKKAVAAAAAEEEALAAKAQAEDAAAKNADAAEEAQKKKTEAAEAAAEREEIAAEKLKEAAEQEEALEKAQNESYFFAPTEEEKKSAAAEEAAEKAAKEKAAQEQAAEEATREAAAKADAKAIAADAAAAAQADERAAEALKAVMQACPANFDNGIYEELEPRPPKSKLTAERQRFVAVILFGSVGVLLSLLVACWRSSPPASDLSRDNSYTDLPLLETEEGG